MCGVQSETAKIRIAAREREYERNESAPEAETPGWEEKKRYEGGEGFPMPSDIAILELTDRGESSLH